MDSPKSPLCTSCGPGPSTRGSPVLFPTNAEAGSPLSCSTARPQGCSCRTHGQARWPKDGEGILGWAQPRDQILHPSPGRGQGQCIPHSRARICPCARAIWAAKLPLPHLPPGHNQEGGSQGWPWLVPQPRDALPGSPAKQRCCWDTPSSLPSPPRLAGLSQLLTEGDGGDTGLLWQAPVPPPRASAVFLQHRNHQEQARQQERRLSQKSRGEERISPPSSGCHPPSWLSSTCCRSGTCHKVR